MKLNHLSLLLISMLISCSNPSANQNENNSQQKDSAVSNAPQPVSAQQENQSQSTDTLKIEVKTFQEKGQWGYDIFVDGKMYIHQPNIPSVPGNSGFKSEDAAKKTGEFIAYKIHHHIMPPSVTPHELDSLDIR